MQGCGPEAVTEARLPVARYRSSMSDPSATFLNGTPLSHPTD